MQLSPLKGGASSEATLQRKGEINRHSGFTQYLISLTYEESEATTLQTN